MHCYRCATPTTGRKAVISKRRIGAIVGPVAIALAAVAVSATPASASWTRTAYTEDRADLVQIDNSPTNGAPFWVYLRNYSGDGLYTKAEVVLYSGAHIDYYSYGDWSNRPYSEWNASSGSNVWHFRACKTNYQSSWGCGPWVYF
jgi:hypothetical protein